MTSCPVFPWGLRWAEALYQPWVPHSWPRDGGRASGWLCTPSARPASPASMENRDTVWKVRPGNGVTPLGVGVTSAAWEGGPRLTHAASQACSTAQPSLVGGGT